MYALYKTITMNEVISEDEFSSIVLDVIKNECNFTGGFLSQEDVDQLISQSAKVVPQNVYSVISKIGYPYQPYYKHIAAVILNWIKNQTCVYESLQTFYMLEEGNYVNERSQKFKDLRHDILGMPSLWAFQTSDEKKYKIRYILERLGGKRGVMDLLGVRCTVGTELRLPPSRDILMEAFIAPCNDKSIMTEGARALTKHFHRDQTDSWWGRATGTEKEKNDHALNIVNKILDSASWVNIHQLPHQLAILEVRHVDSYGARWSADGKTFRGFLEPMQPEGWVNKYKH